MNKCDKHHTKKVEAWHKDSEKKTFTYCMDCGVFVRDSCASGHRFDRGFCLGCHQYNGELDGYFDGTDWHSTPADKTKVNHKVLKGRK